MAVFSLRHRHQGRSLVAEDDQSCFICSDPGADSSFVSSWDHKADSGSLKIYSVIFIFISFDNEYRSDNNLHIRKKVPLHSHLSSPHCYK